MHKPTEGQFICLKTKNTGCVQKKLVWNLVVSEIVWLFHKNTIFQNKNICSLHVVLKVIN